MLIIIVVLIGREGSRAATQIRYASRIVETKSGQIRGILQVCIDFLSFENHSFERIASMENILREKKMMLLCDNRSKHLILIIEVS